MRALLNSALYSLVWWMFRPFNGLVRYKSAPQPLRETLKIDPTKPVVYILAQRSWVDMFVLARLCRDWEKEAAAATRLGVRVASMRTGLVLGPGGPLAKMTTPFKLFAGGKIGSGKQWVSWIHLADAVNAYVAALTDDRYTGAINLVTDSTRNAEVSRAIGHALSRPSWLPVPAFALKAAVGELAETILHGRRAVPAKLRALGFTFEHPTLDEAVTSALA
mgnify:CR=1 FL=1